MRLTLLLTLTTLSALAGDGQPGVGAKYGTRDPRTCKSTVEPSKGAISTDQAKQYFACHVEGLGPGYRLGLAEEVTVQVGKGTPFLELDRGQRPSGADLSTRLSASRPRVNASAGPSEPGPATWWT